VKIAELKKVNQVLIFTFLIIVGLYFGASLLIPLTFAIFFSALILPLANILEKNYGVGRLASSFICTFLIFIGVGLFIFFLINQLGQLLSDIVVAKGEILRFLQEIQARIVLITGFSLEQQEQIFRDGLTDIINITQNYLTNFLANTASVLFDFLIILVYLFLVLLNRDKFVDFLLMYVAKENEKETNQIIKEIRVVAHGYLWGRIQVMLLLAGMYLVAFLAYDLQHTGLLVLFGTLITIIPYIGPFLSGTLPILLMIVLGENSLEIISFSAIIITIQLIESYVLEPVIIGSEVKQSPLFVIIAVLLGGIIWGPAGLILFVPLFAVLKIIFDHTLHLKPIGFLIGYERPGSKESTIEKILRKWKK